MQVAVDGFQSVADSAAFAGGCGGGTDGAMEALSAVGKECGWTGKGTHCLVGGVAGKRGCFDGHITLASALRV